VRAAGDQVAGVEPGQDLLQPDHVVKLAVRGVVGGQDREVDALAVQPADGGARHDLGVGLIAPVRGRELER
jgi:hypothetical protein